MTIWQEVRCVEDAGAQAWISDSRDSGGCSFCARHIGPEGQAYHRVMVVRGRSGGPIVRFCRSCAIDVGMRWPR